MLGTLLQFFESITYLGVLFYWFLLLVVDFTFLNKFILKKECNPGTVSNNFWLPFGIVIPVFWVLNLQYPMIIDLIITGAIGIFYGVIRPQLYSRLLRDKYT